jgi:hypothetical protein
MVIKIIASILLTLSLTACFGQKPFQPHPPTFTRWSKGGVSGEGVKAAMKQCGYIDIYGYGGDRDSTMNERALRQNCMFNNGFRRKDGDQGLCSLKSYKDIPACQSNPQIQ